MDPAEIINAHREEYIRLKKLLKKILHGIKDKYTIWFQHRLKTRESLCEKITNRRKEANDIIGFRIIYPWSDGLYEIAKLLSKEPGLNIESTEYWENNKIIYLYGITSLDTKYEIQLWPTIMYTCFEYEHDKVYKPHPEYTIPAIRKNLDKKALCVRKKQLEIQNYLDANVLVPYNLNNIA